MPMSWRPAARADTWRRRMDSTGGFPIDLVLFGSTAPVLVLPLRGVRAKRQGFERPNLPVQPPATVAPRSMPQGQVIEGTAEAPPKRAAPEPTSEAGQVLVRMQQIDRQFQASRFLEGAE